MNISMSLPLVFLILSTLILILVPALHRLCETYEQESQRVRVLFNLALVALVIHSIVNEAYTQSGLGVLLFAISGFSVSWLISRITSHQHDRASSSSWPVVPTLMAVVVGAHGIFDGLALRVASIGSVEVQAAIAGVGTLQSWASMLPIFPGEISMEQLSAISLALAVMLHRIPESLLIWKLTMKLISVRAAVATLFLLAITTFLGFVLSAQALSYTRWAYVHLSYLQVFIAGALLHTTWCYFIAKNPRSALPHRSPSSSAS